MGEMRRDVNTVRNAACVGNRYSYFEMRTVLLSRSAFFIAEWAIQRFPGFGQETIASLSEFIRRWSFEPNIVVAERGFDRFFDENSAKFLVFFCRICYNIQYSIFLSLPQRTARGATLLWHTIWVLTSVRLPSK